MTISAMAVYFDAHSMWVELSDGRTLGVPLAWYPRLLHARPSERRRVELGRDGLRWVGLGEDISLDQLVAGRRDLTPRRNRAA